MESDLGFERGETGFSGISAEMVMMMLVTVMFSLGTEFLFPLSLAIGQASRQGLFLFFGKAGKESTRVGLVRFHDGWGFGRWAGCEELVSLTHGRHAGRKVELPLCEM